MSLQEELKQAIRSIPDYPEKGVVFRDITTLLQNAKAFRLAIEAMVEPYKNSEVNCVGGIEARGFILGGAVAHQLETGFVSIRKKGKLPFETVRIAYSLEYGIDEMEMHKDSVNQGDKILLVDDLLATGGTAEAAVRLCHKIGAEVIGATFIIDLPELKGREKIEKLGVPVKTLVEFSGT